MLNPHLHSPCVVVDGVFDPGTGGEAVFHDASVLDALRAAELAEQGLDTRFD